MRRKPKSPGLHYGQLLWLAASVLSLTSGCNQLSQGVANVTGTGSGSGSSSGTGVPAPATLNGAALTLVVATAPETAPNNTTVKQTCSVSATAATNTTVNCNVVVPQGDLFYSNIGLTVNAANNCTYVVFQPYYYRASSNPSFIPQWDPKVGQQGAPPVPDCSGNLLGLPLDCYNGPAPLLVPGFPTKQAIYFTLEAGPTASWVIQSAHSQNRLSNRWAADNIPQAEIGVNLIDPFASAPGSAPPYPYGDTAYEDGYIANSFVPYSFTCRDPWWQILFGIDLTISAQVTEGGDGNVNDYHYNYYPDWSGAVLSLQPAPH